MAEKSRATLYTMASSLADLQEVECFLNPEARQREQDLTSDFPGQGFDGKGGGQHALAPKESKKEKEAISFAKTLCDTLDNGRLQGEFNRLVLCAGPHFLGLIRLNLSGPTRQCLVAEIDKNMLKSSADEISQLIHDALKK
ncbi:MAG: host attachment protein [Gammaproteobacteria bacterium]|nr:host attachment protein [Gammaproteobacteria bacterium]MBQ0839987.1 host attachment protein [Gammaproteobacteria bacterium]